MKLKSKVLMLLLIALLFNTLFYTPKSVYASETQYTDNVIPTMESNTSPSGTVTASDYYEDKYSSGAPWKAFDKDINFTSYGSYNTWCSPKSSGWLAYEFPTPRIITKYTIQTNASYGMDGFPKSWTFEAWNGSAWVILDTQSNIISWTNGTKKEFTFINTNPYNKYRINVTSTVSGITSYNINLLIGELEMMETVSSLAVPTGLLAESGDSQITLNWNSVDYAKSYNIKRCTTSDGSYEVIHNLIPGVSTSSGPAITYTDTNLLNGTTYYYVVTAVANDMESQNSNIVFATPKKQNKNKLKIVLDEYENIQLSVHDELEKNIKLIWTSSDINIATVDSNGLVTSLKPGDVIITATNKDGSYIESTNILVVDDAAEYRLAIDLQIGNTSKVTVDDNSGTSSVIWNSIDPTTATISNKGKIKAVSEGLTIMTAVDDSGNIIGQIYVRVRM